MNLVQAKKEIENLKFENEKWQIKYNTLLKKVEVLDMQIKELRKMNNLLPYGRQNQTSMEGKYGNT
jgi:FtsZ-binding cell division protein ZapB